MDGTRFDRLARALASRRTRRGAMVLAGASAVTATALVAAQDAETVVCAWNIEAEHAIGPMVGRIHTGTLTATIAPDGVIPGATLALLEEGSDAPVIFSGVGNAVGRSLDLRLTDGDCATLALTAVAVDEVRRCDVMLDGLFRGVQLAEVGGWRGSPVGLCPVGQSWNGDTCACVASCAEQPCPDGEIWRESVCACACAPEDCDDSEGWSWSACACVPKNDGGGDGGGSAPTATATPGGITVPTNIPNSVCPLNPACPAPKVKDPATCTCVCPPLTCMVGKMLDPDTCTCKFPVLCVPQTCDNENVWMPELCRCSQIRCNNGTIACNGACIDPLTNLAHCGGCDQPCAGTCIAGVCV